MRMARAELGAGRLPSVRSDLSSIPRFCREYDDTPRSPRSICFRTRLENTSPSAQCIAVGRPPYACAGRLPSVRSDLSSIPRFALHLAVGRPPYACAGHLPSVRSDLSSIPRFCREYDDTPRSPRSICFRTRLENTSPSAQCIAVGRPPYA